jgi:hypothetical protein
MQGRIPIYLEVGKKRVFAAAVDWPGWSRSGRGEDEAIDALVAYGERYRKAIGKAASDLTLPVEREALEVVERVPGNATTEFGAPGVPPKVDEAPLDEKEAKRQAALLEAAWKAFDRAAQAAASVELRKGPRGGGRDVPKMTEHVLGADEGYLNAFGDKLQKPQPAEVSERLKVVRSAFLDVLAMRARGEDPPRAPRSGKLWTPRYAVRRSAWHALDHAWEIEDRREPA